MEPDSHYSPKFKTAAFITYLSFSLMIFVLSMMQDNHGEEPNVIHVWIDGKPGLEVSSPELTSNYPISSTDSSNEKEGSKLNHSNDSKTLFAEPENQNSDHSKAVDDEISHDEIEYEPVKQNSNRSEAIGNELSSEKVSVYLNDSESVNVSMELCLSVTPHENKHSFSRTEC